MMKKLILMSQKIASAIIIQMHPIITSIKERSKPRVKLTTDSKRPNKS